MEYKVKNCKDCPFKFNTGYEGEEYSCSIDDEMRVVYRRDSVIHEDIVKFEDDKEWCKLKTEQVIITK